MQMVSNEVVRAGADVLQENIDPSSVPKRRARGGKSSRARRLQNFQELRAATSTTSTVAWARFLYGILRQARAKRHDYVQDAWIRACRARAKIRAAMWRAWTHRSIGAARPSIFWCESDWRFVTGEPCSLAPLSLRDMHVMSRAALFMKQLNVLDPDHELADPTDSRYCRHVLDWLREPTDEGDPHWVHTERNLNNYLAEHGSSSEGGCCTSDEDE